MVFIAEGDETFPIVQDATSNTASIIPVTPTITVTAATPTINTISDLLSKAHLVSTTMFPPFYEESLIFERLLDLSSSLQYTKLITTHLNVVTNCVASTITTTVPSTVTVTVTVSTLVDDLNKSGFVINRLIDVLNDIINITKII